MWHSVFIIVIVLAVLLVVLEMFSWPSPKSKKMMTPEQIKKKFGYGWVGPFSENLARARFNGQWFHVGRDGKPAYEQGYEKVGDFSEGLARVYKDGQEFDIRPDGTRVED